MHKLLGRFGGLVAAVLAAALLTLSPLPGFADQASDRIVLDKLLDQLKDAPDAATAHGLEQQIWRMWIVPADPDLAGKMAAVLAAEGAGNIQAALTLVGKMVVDYPSYAEGWNQRATIEYQLSEYDASLADIDKVLTLEPRHFGALSGRVLIYLAEGKRPEALRAMIAALAIHPYLGTKALFPELSQPKTQA